MSGRVNVEFIVPYPKILHATEYLFQQKHYSTHVCWDLQTKISKDKITSLYQFWRL